MRAVDRNALSPPKVLTAADARGPKELKSVKDHRADPAKKDKAFPFSAYKEAEVKAALEALFHGKCAYCESIYRYQAPVDVEHFRPKGSVEDDKAHPGYWWLAMKWENLLPSCIDCNRRRKQITPQPDDSLTALHEAASKVINTGKKDAFPVGGIRAADEGGDLTAEKAFLLDPTVDNPDEHLVFHMDSDFPTGLVLPKVTTAPQPALPLAGNPGVVATAAGESGLSVRGAVSIQVYGLNRLGLVQERTRILRQLEFLRHVITRIDAIATDVGKSRAKWARTAAGQLDDLIETIIQQIRSMAEPDQPYSAMVRQWIDTYLEDLRTEP